MRIKIKKLAAVPGGAEARLAENHIAGIGDHGDGLSIPVEYEIEGELARPIEVGKDVLVFRDRRNGVKADGIFQTTKVLEVSPEGFRTRNSVYVTGPSCYEHSAPEPNKATQSTPSSATTKRSSK